MTRKVRVALGNMMIWSVVRRADNNGTRPEVWEVGEKNWGELHSG